MLREFNRKYKIDGEDLENSDLLLAFKRDIITKGHPTLFDEAAQLFSDFIKSRKESESGGYFKFAIAYNSLPDMDKIWLKMQGMYGKGKQNDDFIKRILGTICMACAAYDKRHWYCVTDPEKKSKLEVGEIPEATVYFLKTH